MSAIEFVVRDSVGNIRRGSVAGDDTPNTILMTVDQDVSLNVDQSQVIGYQRQGMALQITLIDGRVIVLEGFFTPDGMPANEVFLSSNGQLIAVDLTATPDGALYATYLAQDSVGKFGMNDDLYFMRGSDVMLASYGDNAVMGPADDEAGMLLTPLLGGLGGAFPWLGLGGAAVGAVVIGGGGGTDAVEVTLDNGVKGAGDVINHDDWADGVELGGTGTVGGTVTVTVDGHTEITTVGTDGTWTVTFDPTEIDPGEYETGVTVTITDGKTTATVTDVLVLDTEASVTVAVDGIGGDGVVNAAEAATALVISGAVEAGSTVKVTVQGQTFDAVVTGSAWSLTLPAGFITGGEYDQQISVQATDAYGNSAAASGSFHVDTMTDVIMSTVYGADATINKVEHDAGFNVTGFAEAGASVQVTIGTVTKTVTAGTDGAWTAGFATADVAPGTYTDTVYVKSTDAAGNTDTVSSPIHFDTEAAVTINTASVEGNGIVNFAEAADGVTLTGTAQAGSTVVVQMNGYSKTVIATGAGTWSAVWAAGELPAGEVVKTVTATATDAVGNTASATGEVTFDTLVTPFTLTSAAPGGADQVINFNESGQAISLSGAVEAGSVVVVTLGTATLTATVTDGAWTVNFPAGTLPGGEYTTQMVVKATDKNGNSSTMTESVVVDTVAGNLTLSPNPIEADDVVNKVELDDGVLIHGTATPGLVVTVMLGTATHQVVAGADGTWSSTFLKSEVPAGTYDAPISAKITDAAGNTKLVTDTVHIDTEINVSIAKPIETDNIINKAEAADGAILTGAAEAGSTVVVGFGSASKTVIAEADGTWSAAFSASQIPGGESTVTLTAKATDAAGNVANTTTTVQVDTIVNALTHSGQVETDGIVNAAEAADGVTLTGTVEKGSTVQVTIQDPTTGQTVTHAAAVATNGTWTVDFAASEIAAGDYTANVTIAATDAVGNTKTITDTFVVDTVAPDAPSIVSVDEGTKGIRSLGVAEQDASMEVFSLRAGGVLNAINYTAIPDTDYPEIDLKFGTPVQDGTQLVITSTDDAGNTTGTLVLVGGSSDVSISSALAAETTFGAIDLQFLDDGKLVLTADDVRALSGESASLTVHGDEFDTVALDGANKTGTTQIDGRTYEVWEFAGDGATVTLDSQIDVFNGSVI